MEAGELLLSCCWAVLTLLPKKGDLCSLKNWRPVALIYMDYKILSKGLSNRLNTQMVTLVHKGQSYCLPGHTILDNLFDLWDMIDLSKHDEIGFGLVSLDLEKRLQGMGSPVLCWREQACALLRGAGGMGLDWQLFLIRNENLNTGGLTDFYGVMLRGC
ncbi:hypothetical protein AAFF_G00429880 [Aldrovandia affinis]|uniref:Uncharacterized protein n=1 Tax=Aldrovandia affinis TaxID=143900 RepID=A0AAD7WJB6_9TELE|nr:hypothetical protein AAFF_G00429880 [Aldrovandia affinis]